MKYIRWFDDISTSELGLVGGKGANLGELTRAGLPVPPGFCVTSTAYQEFLHQNSLDELIAAVLVDIHLDDLADIDRRAASIQAAIEAAQFPLGLLEDVCDGYDRLCSRTTREVPLAVRSSATAEDQANASFAGQLETYLNVRGVPALLEHIKRCWASLWANRVVAYIANQGLNHRTVSMAVVVQAMIPSEISGVMFTANPVTGNRDEAVINASWGLGEAIVSGLVSPDTITACKSSGQIVSSQVGPKELMVAYDGDGGTTELPVAEERRSVLALSHQQVRELVALGSRIEAHYGRPQDIEWGYSDHHWYLLQTRPITTLAQPEQTPHAYPPGEFNRTMFVEIFPEALTPIFLSVVATLFKDMLDYTFRAMGFEPVEGIQAIGTFYNQPYFNRDYIAAAFQPLSPAVREKLIDQFVNPIGTREKSAGAQFSLPYFRMLYRSLQFMVRFPQQLPGLLQTYQAKVADVSRFPYQTATDSAICERVLRLTFEDGARLLNNDFLMIAVSGRLYRMLGALLRRLYQADTEEVVRRLISGVTGNITMETNKRLWDLAQIARSSPAIASVLRDYAWPQAGIELQKFDQGRQFLQAFDQFLEEFGHREVHFDILYPTWSEDPQPVFAFLRSYLDADETQSPYYQQERLIKERQELTRMVSKDLKRGVLGRLLWEPAFRWLLHHTQLHTRERDTMHFEMTRLFPPMRRLLLELGGRWVSRGLIDQAEDVFFLEVDELIQMAKAPFPAQERIHARREAYRHSIQHGCPAIIRNGDEVYAEREAEAVGANGLQGGLQGIAGSPGKLTGVSRVVCGPQDFHKLKKGEILVAPITNPVWTPLFSVAGAVVTEVGGILSHGAIVAREYGIPAVMSVVGATRLLQDGQRITVDGDKGLVLLGEEV